MGSKKNPVVRKIFDVPEGYISVVFAPGIPALAAAEEVDLALICSTELYELPECKICRAGATAPRPRGDHTVAEAGKKI